MSMQLSAHFYLEEFTLSQIAVREGIDNTPPAAIVEVLRDTAGRMEDVRAALVGSAVSISSGYRCEALERVLTRKDFERWAVKRNMNPTAPIVWQAYFLEKAHPKGVAVDFTAPTFGPPAAIVQRLKTTLRQFDQLILEGSWVHVSFDARCRREVLTATFSNGTPSYVTS